MADLNETLNFDSIDSVLAFAIEKEEEAHEFYVDLTEKIKNKAIKGVLDELARQELKHKGLLLKVQAGQPFESTVKKVIDLKIGDYFKHISPSADMSYQDALQIAIQREIGAQELYNYLSSNSKDDRIRSTFESLAKEEAKHKLRLEQIYDDDILRDN